MFLKKMDFSIEIAHLQKKISCQRAVEFLITSTSELLPNCTKYLAVNIYHLQSGLSKSDKKKDFVDFRIAEKPHYKILHKKN